MKKLILFLAVSALLLSGLSSCGRRAPKIEEIYDRAVELIEASYEVNVLFYGEGLPYYDRTLPIYQDLYSDYTVLGYAEHYHIVNKQAKYRSIDAMKAAAEQVYTKEMLETTVYPAAFEGVVITDAAIGVTSSDARYLQTNDHLYISIQSLEEYHPPPLIYDYATMRIVRPSNASRVLIEVNAWEVDKPQTVLEIRLSLALQDGVWLLDFLTV